jgi:uncharacterized protein (TIGR01777 family)
MRVFVTGGTGLIGRRLIRQLLARGDQVVLLTRRYGTARQMFGPECGLVEGDPMQAQEEWMNAAADCDGVVNLAGENVFNKRWNAAVKQLLIDSRVKSAEHVAQALARKPRRGDGQPRVLVNASAIGIYGPQDDEELTEDSPAGNDFLARLCLDWEKAARAVESSGVRCAVVRVGIVLDAEGGALAKMLTPFKMCAGGPIGNGRQYMSWIHHEDMTGVLLHALDSPAVSGSLNGTAPNPVTNRVFSKALGRALHRPAFLPMPRFALRLLIGEAADVVATGQRVLPTHTVASGYVYRFAGIDDALENIVG